MRKKELAKRVVDVIPLAMRFIRREVKSLPQAELSFPQYRLLSYLGRGPTTNRQLAEWQGVSVAAMSRTLDNLVRKGMVARERAAGDRRQVRLEVTELGRSAVSRTRAAIEARVNRRLASLPSLGKRQLRAGLACLEEIFS